MNEVNSSAAETAVLQPEASVQSLKKVLKTRDLVIFGMVFMAPVSAQTLFGELTQLSNGHAVLSYLVGLIAMIFTAFCYGKMAGAFPAAGSTYSYTSQAIHPRLGFLAGWAILLDYLLIPMLLYKISAIFLMELLPSAPLWILLLLFVVPVTLSNYLGAQVTSRVNLYMMLFMFFSLVLFIVFAAKSLVSAGGMASLFSLQGIYNPDTFSMNALITGASIAVLSYLGFDAVTTMAEDSKVTGKMVGRAAIFSLLISSFFYICQVYFATLIMPDFTSFASQETAFFEIAAAVGGSGLAAVCTLIIAVSGISTALAGQASSSRILFSMGKDRMLPQFFASLHPKYRTPANSIVALAIAGYIGAVVIPLPVLFQLIVIGALFGFICVNLSVMTEFYFRRRERQGWLFVTNLLFPLLGLFVCGYILLGISPIGKLVGLIWLSLGLCLLTYTVKIAKREVSAFNHL